MMDRENILKELFRDKMKCIIGQQEIDDEYVDGIYENLKEFYKGERVVDAVVDAVPIKNDKRQGINLDIDNNTKKGEIIVIDELDIVHIKGKEGEHFKSEHYLHFYSAFKKMLKMLNLSKNVADKFIYKGDYYVRINSHDNTTRYAVNKLGDSPRETINCLEKCMKLVNGEKKVCYTQCVECCEWLIDMLPMSKIDISIPSWEDCRYEICESFRKIYDIRGEENYSKSIMKCGAKVCDAEHWKFIYDLNNYYSPEQIEEFCNQVGERIRGVFEDQRNIFIQKNEYYANGERYNLMELYLKNKF